MTRKFQTCRASLDTPQKTKKTVQNPDKNPKRDVALIAQILRAL